jgi:hypothetical protein
MDHDAKKLLLENTPAQRSIDDITFPELRPLETRLGARHQECRSTRRPADVLVKLTGEYGVTEEGSNRPVDTWLLRQAREQANSAV